MIILDLLFKNPQYFFSTYFDFSIKTFCLLFIDIFLIILISTKLFSKKKSVLLDILNVLILSLYLSLIICITLFNRNRIGLQFFILNPFYEIKEIFINNDVHFIRGTLSNVILYIPLGFILSLNFKKRKIIFSIVFCTALSVVIEILQYVLCVGCFETWDIICNVFGVVIAVFIFKFYIFLRYIILERYVYK